MKPFNYRIIEDNIDLFEEYKDRFITAKKADYCRNIQKKDLERFRDIYKQLSGSDEYFCLVCSVSILKMIKKLEPYWSEYEKSKDREVVEDQQRVDITPTRSRKGRPKKTDN